MPLGYLGIRDDAGLGWLWTISELRVLAALLVGVLALLVRYRRADETGRRQLLWLLLAALVVLAAITPWSLVAGTPIVVLFSIPLDTRSRSASPSYAISSWTSGWSSPAPWPGCCSPSPPSSPTSRW